MKRGAILGLLAAVGAVIIVSGAGVAANVGNVREALLAGKAHQGRVLFTQVCRSCHSSEPDHHKNGPTLFGVVGRAAGSVQDFDYSDAMRAANVTWTDESLDRYLADTKHFIPGNHMPYSFLMGTQNKERRDSVIAYLHTLQ
jgi:cytochrome c